MFWLWRNTLRVLTVVSADGSTTRNRSGTFGFTTITDVHYNCTRCPRPTSTMYNCNLTLYAYYYPCYMSISLTHIQQQCDRVQRHRRTPHVQSVELWKFDKVGCCVRDGVWFKNCGDVGGIHTYTKFDHTWVEDIQSCKSQLETVTVHDQLTS